MFFADKKKAAGSIVDHFEANLPREKSDKIEFSKVPAEKMAEGGEADEHMQALASHSEEMHEAQKAGDHMRHAKAMKAFLQEHEAHKEEK